MEAIIFKKEVNKGRLTNIYDSIWKGTIYIRPLESPLDCKEIKPVNTKGNQPWIFIGRLDAEGETAILFKELLYMLPTKGSFHIQGHTQAKREKMEKISHRNGNQRRSTVAILRQNRL